jgi:hypothetical protein
MSVYLGIYMSLTKVICYTYRIAFARDKTCWKDQTDK